MGDLANRNARATKEALEHQNKTLADFENRLSSLERENNMLRQEVNNLKQQHYSNLSKVVNGNATSTG